MGVCCVNHVPKRGDDLEELAPCSRCSSGRALKSRAVLALRTGTYYFVTLDLEPQAIVTLDQTAGPVLISVKSNIIYNGSFTDLRRQLTNVDLTYLGTNGVFINTAFLGVIRAPNGYMGPSPHDRSDFRYVQVLSLPLTWAKSDSCWPASFDVFDQ